MARLSGTGRLADDLYLMAHHDISGKPHLQPQQLDPGLREVIAQTQAAVDSALLWVS